MNEFFKGIGMTYLIWPFLGMLFVFVGIFIAKKNALLSNKRLIWCFIAAILVLSLPGLMGYLDYYFMPYGYIILSVFYLVLGWYNFKLIRWIFKGNSTFVKEIVFTLFILAIGMLFFALIFNLTNDLKYGFLASTTLLSMILTMLLIKSYELFLGIPEPIYQMWKYNDDTDSEFSDNIDYGRLKVVTLEIFKQDGDAEPLRMKVKVPDAVAFEVWIKMLIEDYNKQSSMSPINYQKGDDYDSWVFYKHNYILLPKRYIDPIKTIEENKIGENCFIVAKRVKEYVKI